MGQTPSKKMGRTRSKELSGNDLSEAMASHTIRGDGPDSAAGTSPGGGGLSGSAPIDVGPASPRGAGGKRGASGKGPEKQGSVSSLSSAAALGSSLGRANSPYDAASVRSSNSTGGDKALAPNVPANNTIAASPRSGLRSSLLGSSPPPSLSVPGSSPGNLATSPPASPGGRDLSPVNALTATISRNSMAGAGGQVLDVDNMISRLIEAGYSGKVTKSPPLKIAEINAVCLAAREVFLSQPTLIELSPPVKIVGDVHGQYADLIRLFEMCGFPPQANYLFLGDYVDRGKQSLETILLLLCYKIKFPENFFLLRGNHECANVTRVYGFYDECKRRTNIKTWKTFIDVFNTLPIASIVASKIFCVHGGLSPSLKSMDDIRRLVRPTDVPDYGLLNDLVWSDPSDTALDWEDNERGVSFCYGKSVINAFLATHDMDLICRAHMVVEDGYEFYNDRTLVTVFSAPNYCGEFDNFGAVMSVSEDLLCSFELLKPLDGAALKKEMTKSKRKSLQNHQSPPNNPMTQSY